MCLGCCVCNVNNFAAKTLSVEQTKTLSFPLLLEKAGIFMAINALF